MRTTRPWSADRTSGASARSSIETGSPAPVRLRISPPQPASATSHGQTIGCRDVLAKVEGRLVAIPLEVLGRAALRVHAAARAKLEAHGYEQPVARGGGEA